MNLPEFSDDNEDAVRPRRKGIFLLPNLFTLAALFGGFYAIVMSMNGRYENAALGIFCAMILDSLDGRVARMTNTQSTFGEQMDSLSDMVSFGAAPALIMYSWGLTGLRNLGWIAAFVYCACAALRLARFNTNLKTVDNRFFQGLPSPAAAALVIGFIWMLDDNQLTAAQHGWIAWLSFGLTIFAGLTMVSNVPFYSFKDISFKKSVPFVVIVAVVLGIGIVNLDPPRTLFALFCLYAVSGYFVYFYRRMKGRRASLIAISTDEPEEEGLHR